MLLQNTEKTLKKREEYNIFFFLYFVLLPLFFFLFFIFGYIRKLYLCCDAANCLFLFALNNVLNPLHN